MFFFFFCQLKWVNCKFWANRPSNFERTAPFEILSEPSKSNRPRRNWILWESSRSHSLGGNIWCDNKLQITTSEVLISRSSKHTNDTFDQKSEKGKKKKRRRKEEYIGWEFLKGSAGMFLQHTSKSLSRAPGSTNDCIVLYSRSL